MTALPPDVVADLGQENARLQAELRAARDRQAGSAEILRAIASTSGDAELSLQQIAETTARLFGASSVTLRIASGGEWSRTINVGPSAKRIGLEVSAAQLRIGARNLPGTVVLENRQIHIPDINNVDPAIADWPGLPPARAAGTRVMAGTPLRREGNVIGVLIVHRDRPEPFTAEELALQQSFADQAVIAIENARLFNETQEALERQTATADILKVIASSPSDVQPVFEAIAESAKRLSGGHSATVTRVIGDLIHLAAFTAGSEAGKKELQSSFPTPLSSPGIHSRVARTGKLAFRTDIETEPDVPPGVKELARARGYRSILVVPMLREGVSIGTIGVTRRDPGPFAANIIDLLKTFADQAVIAIENARLFNETREALERQTATAEILNVIASSPSDVQPVFDVIVERAVRLCGGRMGRVYRYDGGVIQMVAGHGLSAPGLGKVQQVFPRPASDDTIAGRVMLSHRPCFVTDIQHDDSVPPLSRQMIEALGTRSQVTVPMLRTGEAIGAITVGWADPGAFGDQQVSLLQTFADQAVIAIENVRLFNETNEALERQTATADILKVIASSPSDVQPVFEAIATSSNRLIGGFSTAVLRFIGDELHLAAFTPTNAAADNALKASFPRPLAEFPPFMLVRDGRTVQIVDTESDDVPHLNRELARLRGYRSMLFTPLMNGETPIGLISVTRKEPGTFAAHHIQLVRTFADQAVIAIENVRLFDEVQARTRDLTESLQQQTATADVLKVISASPGELEPVFQAMLENAVRLCEAEFAILFLREENEFRAVGKWNLPPAFSEFLGKNPIRSDPKIPLGRVAITKQPVQVADVLVDQSYIERFPGIVGIAELGGARTLLQVPMLKENELVGTIGIYRQEVRPFSDKQVDLVANFAKQAVIAIENTRLLRELRQRTDDLSESLQQQTATAEVLKVISRSAFDLQAVFDTLLSSAVTLIGASGGTICVRDGDVFPYRATAGASAEFVQFLAEHPATPGRQSTAARVILSGQVVVIPDMLEDSEYALPLVSLNNAAASRSSLGVPLLRNDRVEGALVLVRMESGPFDQRQIELVKTFADQAVIAIENVRLFDEVQAKTRDLTQALTYQTGSSNILGVIASSPTDVGPVLKAIVESACELCEAHDAIVVLQDGGDLRIGAHHGPIPTNLERWPNNRDSVSGLAIANRQPVHMRDVLSDEGAKIPIAQQLSRQDGCRSILGVPMLREGESIGAIVLRRTEVHPFSDKQIALLQTFADQAVIAIGNVRLFDEVQAKTRDLTEALTYQTGSSNILRVIASSPTDVEPVLKAIVESACELCEAYDAIVRLRDGDDLRLGAHHGPIPTSVDKLPITRDVTAGRAFLDRKPVHVHDLLATEGAQFPKTQQMSRLEGGHRTVLSVPLLREGESIGVIVLRRIDVHPFSDKQIALLQTFADQAVIAIGNVRLFDEVQAKTRDLTEALEQQTATSEVLEVISASSGDLDPVFQKMLENATRICGANFGAMNLYDGDCFRNVALYNVPEEFTEQMREPIRPHPKSGLGTVARTHQAVQIEDLRTQPPYLEGDPAVIAMSDLAGARTIVIVPMLRENELVGTIAIYRQEVRSFTDKQVDLVANFAKQAVIAIENTRLLKELRQRTDDLGESLQFQTATSDVLKVISSSPDTLQPVLDVIVNTSRHLCGTETSTIFLLKDGQFHIAAASGTMPEYLEFLRANPIALDQPGSSTSRAAREKRTVHIPDIGADPEFGQGPMGVGQRRALLSVPLMREGTAIGVITMRQSHLTPFTERQIEVVQTFADQAVIAISNVRLFEEVQERTRELSQSLDDLRTAQDRLVQTEKLASLGQLTAGIAHEIKNPLNFVNNFSALSAELTDELNDVLKSVKLADNIREEVDELTGLLKDNLGKVVQHGKRADSIVKNMLLHSREGSGDHRPADINALVDESLNLAYHGARAEKPQFNVTLQRNFDPNAGMIEAFPQEITRVFLNLISNGFYAVTKRKADNGGTGFEPVVSATTKDRGNQVEIRIRDNGTGIPPEVMEKMFNPFFTTKPAGEGTGLGLSMSHDIIVKQHGGTIDVDTEPGQFTEFRIVLPRTSNISNKSRG